MATILRRDGYCANQKRIQGLCRDEGLSVLNKAEKRSRVGTTVINGARLRGTRPTRFGPQFDQTNFKTLKLLNITNEFTKETLAVDVHHLHHL